MRIQQGQFFMIVQFSTSRRKNMNIDEKEEDDEKVHLGEML